MGHSLLHVAATQAHGAHCIGEGESACGDMRGVLTQRMSSGEGRSDVARLELGQQNAKRSHGDGQDRRLCVLGQAKLVLRPFEDELGKSKAEGRIGLFKDGAGCGRLIVECTAHADCLRALSGEEKRWFH